MTALNTTITPITESFENIRNWAHARNLINGATPHTQFVKLVEEFKEFVDGHLDMEFEEILDGLGDTVVVLTIQAAQLGTDIETSIAGLDEHLEFANSFEGLLSKTQSVDLLSLRVISSIGELATGIAKKDLTKVHNGIGGAYRILEAIALRFDFTIEYAVERAYNVIKDRKGQMIDGVFVKEADLPNYGIAS